MPVPTFPLVTLSFFVADITIPNTATPAIIERVNAFIVKFEKECLIDILGYELYKAFTTEDSARMTALLSGQEYTDSNDELQKWQGLVHDTNRSLLAYYIYWKFQEASATQTTGVSTGAMKTQAGVSVSPAEKMVSAFNCFSNETNDLLSFLRIKNLESTPVYPEFTYRQAVLTANFSRPVNIFSI